MSTRKNFPKNTQKAKHNSSIASACKQRPCRTHSALTTDDVFVAAHAAPSVKNRGNTQQKVGCYATGERRRLAQQLAAALQRVGAAKNESRPSVPLFARWRRRRIKLRALQQLQTTNVTAEIEGQASPPPARKKKRESTAVHAADSSALW